MDTTALALAENLGPHEHLVSCTVQREAFPKQVLAAKNVLRHMDNMQHFHLVAIWD